eukprot:15436797-Alexandrium_andersonii.AAC.1
MHLSARRAWEVSEQADQEGFLQEAVLAFQEGSPWYRLVLILTKTVRELRKQADTVTRKVIAAKKSVFSERMRNKHTGMQSMYRALKATAMPAMHYVRSESGEVASSPQLVDEEMDRQWGKIYAGCGDVLPTAAAFLEKHAAAIVQQDEYRVDPLQAGDLLRTLRSSAPSAAGLDNWAPAELRNAPQHAIEWLCKMLQLIETGCAWPAELVKARSVHLAKTLQHSDDAMAYRAL